MNLLEKATTITTATAYDNGKLHSVKGGSVADFDVVRGSLATRVNAEGLIEDISTLSGELVTNGDFSNGASDWNLTSGASIGENKLDINANAYDYFAGQLGVSTIGKTYKVSVDAEIQSGRMILYLADTNAFEVIDTSGSYTFYIVADGTQIRFRAFDTALIGSITNISVVEVIEATNIPRIDYTDGTASILLEPQSTNLLPYSEDLSQWTEARVAYTSETGQSIISGKSIVNKLTDTTVNNTHIVYTTPLSLSGDFEYTFSSFLKKGSLNYGFLAFANSGISTCIFNLDLGTIHSQGADIQSAKIEGYGGGWYKCSVTFTEDLSGQLLRIGTSDGNRIYTGSGAGYIYFDAAQLEQQSYATSYIPTSGAIATRLADSVTGAGDATTFNSTEGVLYAEMAALEDGAGTRTISLSDGTNNNSVTLRYTTNTGILSSFIVVGGFIQFSANISGVSVLDFNKVAVKYKENDFALWINGVEVATDTSGSIPSGLSELNFTRADGANNLYAKVKSVITYNTALTDAELECLTTI